MAGGGVFFSECLFLGTSVAAYGFEFQVEPALGKCTQCATLFQEGIASLLLGTSRAACSQTFSLKWLEY